MSGAAALEALAEHFRTTTVFDHSPLYKVLVRTAAEHPDVLRLVEATKPGQQPSFLLLGAVHLLLLQGAEHPLRSYYRSVVGSDAVARPDKGCADAFVDFCCAHADEIRDVTGERLVQTNSVRRALALWLGMNFVAGSVAGPVHLIEVGASAGLNLLFDRYAYRVGKHIFGDVESPVKVTADLRGDRELGPASMIPSVASRLGLDLNPLQTSHPRDREWLRALVWPDEHERLQLLDSALSIATNSTIAVRPLDVTTVNTPIDLGLPDEETRVLFHSATRMHVPPELQDRFDKGVDFLGSGGPAYLITMEATGDGRAGVLRVRAPDGVVHDLLELDGHVTWVRPIARA